ncbi:MAG: Mur ligase domain-containing protein [Kiritimatiellia bacterium]|nr:Mur ligase domain-containing protein [Kiritimatiellia bacterium]
MTPLFTQIHLVGVGGVGMSALAEILLGSGCRVSGSDRFLDRNPRPPVFDHLAAAGVELFPQDGSGIRPDCSCVGLSTAIEAGNPDLEAALQKKIPILHRAEILARLTEGHSSIAVAGTAGKTTVTGMLGWIFEYAGRDPTVINGGALLDWVSDRRTGNTRLGRSDWWIFEADESDRSFLRYSPDWALVTNLSKDHFEWSETVPLFREFAKKIRRGILAGPDAAERIGGEICQAIAFETGDPILTAHGCRFQYAGSEFRIPLAGRHNAENALLAAAMARETGIPPEQAALALKSFRGIARRMERVSTPDAAVAVFDDMAHNPAKIRAAWTAVAQERSPVTGIWRPHGFGPLSLMFNELVETFDALLSNGGRLFLLPVFYAGGTARGTQTSEDLARALQNRGRPVEAVADQEAETRLQNTLTPGSALLILGARDPALPELARRCARFFETRFPTS